MLPTVTHPWTAAPEELYLWTTGTPVGIQCTTGKQASEAGSKREQPSVLCILPTSRLIAKRAARKRAGAVGQWVNALA